PCPIEEDMSQRLRKALVIFEGLFRDRLELIGDGSPEVREEVGLGRIVVEERRTRDLRLFGDLIGTHAIDIALGQSDARGVQDPIPSLASTSLTEPFWFLCNVHSLDL